MFILPDEENIGESSDGLSGEKGTETERENTFRMPSLVLSGRRKLFAIDPSERRIV